MLVKAIARFLAHGCGNLQSVPSQTPLIVISNYLGEHPDLPVATKEAIWFAAALHNSTPQSKVIFTRDNGPLRFAQQSHITRMLREANVPLSNIYPGDQGADLLSEVRAVRKIAVDAKLPTKNVVVVCVAAQSRTMRLAYESVFPKSKVVVLCLEGTPEIEDTHPSIVRRKYSLWLLKNVLDYYKIKRLIAKSA